MKKSKLTTKETILVASTLFGMFFSAYNLIFPVHLGQMAGSNSWPAIAGFCITAVIIPILAVAAIGRSHCDNLLQLSGRVGAGYGRIFTAVLYLTIGPLFAIPRCASVSFTTGVEPMTSGAGRWIWQLVFTFLFFAFVMFFSLRPSRITTWVGKIITPVFLVLLGVLVIASLAAQGAHVSDIAPEEAYITGAFFGGFTSGYSMMDAIAGLAFGIVIIDVIRDLGISDDSDVASETIRSGAFTAVLMVLIYVLTVIMGARSRGMFDIADNGGAALAQISGQYLGSFGRFLLAAAITLACLTTAVGLVTSCGEMFVRLIPGKLNYRGWAMVFTLFSFIVSNVGLTAITRCAEPVLRLIYPLAITLILLALFDKFFGASRYVYMWVTIGAAVPAIFDFMKAAGITPAAELGSRIFPLFDLGMGWIIPSLAGLVAGIIISKIKGKSEAA